MGVVVAGQQGVCQPEGFVRGTFTINETGDVTSTTKEVVSPTDQGHVA